LWIALVGSIRAKGTLPPCLAVVDVSGSMSGLPLQAAVSMGLLLAELSPDPWHGRMLTFSSEPAWFEVPNTMTSLEERVKAVVRMPWEMTTNFSKALALILNTAVERRVPPEDMPRILFVLTDMHFDAANGPRDNRAPDAAAEISAAYTRAHYMPPRVVFWNLRAAGAPVFQAETDTPGVSFMSGFSPKVLTDFMATGELNGVDATATPWDMLRTRLERDRLLAVRHLAARVQEGCMAGYVVPEKAAAPGGDDEEAAEAAEAAD
jgi:hypothetical protein